MSDTLPIQPPYHSVAKQANNTNLNLGREMNMHKLLIIDDDELIGHTIKTIAEQCGFDTIYTDSALMFYEQLALFEPDLMMVDLIMPNVDGMQLIERLAELNPHAHLIIISGAGKRVVNSSALSAQEHGLKIAGLLNKPFRAAELRQLLLDFIKQQRHKQVEFEPVVEKPSWFPEYNDLATALERGDIHIALQPQLSTRTGLLLGFEALARWQHAEHGNVPPDHFIPLAERTHLIEELTTSIVEQALSWFKQLYQQAPPQAAMSLQMEPDNLTLAINLSVVNLHNRHLPDELLEQCTRHGVPPERIVLEVTETTAMDNPTEMLDILTRLRIKGFGLSIDDFGTGYSSLAQLARLPFSELKVDRSFVMRAEQSHEARAVIKSVVDLAHSLSLNAIAEGVDSEYAKDYLRKIGCDVLQGYYIATPMEPTACSDWIEQYYCEKEEQRQAALEALNILDTDREYRFDRITSLAKRLFNVPASIVSLIDHERQWFKSADGFDATETHRDISFCSHALSFQDTMVVSDSRQHARFKDNPVTCDPTTPVVFYAGTQLAVPTGERVGTLCLIDHKPRHFSDQERVVLEQLGRLVEHELMTSDFRDMDSLTGTFNRSAFETRSREIYKLAERSQLHLDIALIDIKNFREFNNIHGHNFGDGVLLKLADILRRCFRRSDIIGRYAGDKFAICMVNSTRADALDFKEVTRRINDAVGIQINADIDSGKPRLRLCFGLATYEPITSKHFSELLFDAELQVAQQRHAAES